ncbi:DUF3857 domain-containing protein [Rufibacter roseus]|uniref:DUF3857 domain-containing protein n=1 Tax=Rufibacter roseus TaxID=1567108 RepID=UPI000834701C|nr:DUF3857 domain-containing protein [Rufibacter roseus]
MVLYDYGESAFEFTKGTQVVFKRTTRIKILKKNGLDQADIFIPFYQKDFQNREEVKDVKGFTYNLENGKVVKVKLDEKSIFEEKQDANWHQKKLTMPNAKVGSVIEISYTIKSDFIENLREWEFQNTIPVMWSEYRVEMVPFFEYTHLLSGFNSFHIKDAQVLHQTKGITYEEKVGYQTVQQRSSMSMQILQYRFVMKDLPAFTEEPYLTSIDDYKSKMEFMLTKIQYPNQEPRYMASNWDGFAKELLKEENFGGQLVSSNFTKKIAEELNVASADSLAKVKKVLAYVQKQMSWDGKNRVYSENIKKAHDSRKGSSADINLLLTALLREVGIEASPMLISTRQHGKPVTEMPMLSKFNYVVAHVKIGKNTYLLDATEPDVPFGMLPFRCLNGKGWVAELPSGRWVPIKNSERNVQMVSADLQIMPTGEVVGTMEETFQGISALRARSYIRTKGQEEFIKNFSDKGQEWVRQEVKIQNMEKLQEPLKTQYKLTKAGDLQPVQLLYVTPMLNHAETENPFKIAERLYPIDFATPSDEVYVFTFTIPEGYEVEELPQGKNLSLPNNTARFIYAAQIVNGKLQVMSRLNINKEVFGPEEYANLRELYNQLVAKHAEKIVLRKKS